LKRNGRKGELLWFVVGILKTQEGERSRNEKLNYLGGKRGIRTAKIHYRETLTPPYHNVEGTSRNRGRERYWIQYKREEKELNLSKRKEGQLKTRIKEPMVKITLLNGWHGVSN